MVASKYSGITSEKYKTVQRFKLQCLKIVSLCNCSLLLAAVKVLEPFLEAILWKPFQLFRRILNAISSKHKSAVPSALISGKGTGKNQVEPGQELMGDAAMLPRK